MSNTATATLPILTALNETYQKIRTLNPEVPNAVIVVGAPGKVRGGQVHGHFLAQSWTNPDWSGNYDDAGNAEGDENSELHEISLSGESLERGARGVLGTLIHEAAHALAFERNVKDTSNAGRYHNKKFRTIGEELGILLEQAGTIGWSSTRLSMVTYIRYYREIQALDATLGAYRLPEYSRTVKPRKRTKMVMDCDCDKPVTVSRIWFEEAAARLSCQDCLGDFHEVEGDDE